MSELDTRTVLSRRSALALGSRIATGLIAGVSLGVGVEAEAANPRGAMSTSLQDHDATLDQIETIIQAQGMVDNGIFTIEIDRNDITNVTLRGVPIKPSFEINGTLYFEKFNNGLYYMNGDMALKEDEIDHFIDQLLAHDIVFQAEHQHFYDFDPPVWFIHFRKIDEPLRIARAMKAAYNVTSTPFPQTMPPNPTTPLPAHKIGRIIGGSVSIGSDGVVNIDVPRLTPITLGGVHVSPFLGVQTTIAFQPLDSAGKSAAAAPDFGMIASEVQKVVSVMRKQGWDIGCLYNQETDEKPQLYFSHQFKTGDPIALAHEIRRGLDQMNVKFIA